MTDLYRKLIAELACSGVPEQPKPKTKPELIAMKIEGLGVPIDGRFIDAVRERARKLANKRPSFYRVDGIVLWCATVDKDIFDAIYNWVLYDIGNEPD